jgi:hypothetical protein
MTSNTYFMGLDIGQARDYTALAIIERNPVSVSVSENEMFSGSSSMESRLNLEYNLRHCERLPLETSYTDVEEYIYKMVQQFKQQNVPLFLVVDATGVGRAIIDSFKLKGLQPIPVTVTGGQHTSFEKGYWSVPKRDLVSVPKVLLGKKRLKIAKGTPFRETLMKELQNFHVKVNIATGHDSYEAWREGEHDDLVFAVSLACWYAQKKGESGFMPVIVGEGMGTILPG